jgi:peptide/nickel transport system substrate-binding protein
MSFLYPPFDDPKIRRTALLAISQKDLLAALAGNPRYYKICGVSFGCGTLLETDVGSETVVKCNGQRSIEYCVDHLGCDQNEFQQRRT